MLFLAVKKHVDKKKPLTSDLKVQLVAHAISMVMKPLQAASTSTATESDDNKAQDVSGNAPDTAASTDDTQDTSTSSARGGWICVGFPETAAQAMALEKELTGFEVPKAEKKKPVGKKKSGKAGARDRSNSSAVPPAATPVEEKKGIHLFGCICVGH